MAKLGMLLLKRKVRIYFKTTSTLAALHIFPFIYYFQYLYANYWHLLEEERRCKHSF